MERQGRRPLRNKLENVSQKPEKSFAGRGIFSKRTVISTAKSKIPKDLRKTGLCVKRALHESHAMPKGGKQRV